MITKHTAYKYEAPYMGPFVITQCFTNGTVELWYGSIKVRSNIRHINPYKLDTKIENINSENMNDGVNV